MEAGGRGRPQPGQAAGPVLWEGHGSAIREGEC